MTEQMMIEDAHEHLRNTAHEHAMQHEPTGQFPGVDIDAIHYKLGKVRK